MSGPLPGPNWSPLLDRPCLAFHPSSFCLSVFLNAFVRSFTHFCPLYALRSSSTGGYAAAWASLGQSRAATTGSSSDRKRGRAQHRHISSPPEDDKEALPGRWYAFGFSAGVGAFRALTSTRLIERGVSYAPLSHSHVTLALLPLVLVPGSWETHRMP